MSDWTPARVTNQKKLNLLRRAWRFFMVRLSDFRHKLQYPQARGKTFRFQGRTFNYFHHDYHATWLNERAVEIPIASEWLARYRGKKILEIGNVMSHYQPIDHVVVDKYENSKGVIAMDADSIPVTTQYDLIISISTLEHMGWDEMPQNPLKPRNVIRHLRQCLTNTGTLVMTFPVGYNPFLDVDLRAGNLVFDELHAMKRVSRGNHWIECQWTSIQNDRFSHPYGNANGLVIGIARESK